MNVFVVIIFFFLLGIALRFFFSPPQRLSDWLNLFVIHIAFPAVILTIVPFMHLSVDVFIPMAAYWPVIPIAWWLSKSFSRHFAWTRDIQTVCFVFLFCGNTAFLGIPMAKAFLETQSIAYALLYDQFGTFIGLATIVTITVARYKDANAKTDVKALLFKVLKFTPFPVLLVSLLLPIESLVTPVLGLLEWLAKLIVPAAMVVVGLQFTLKIEEKYRLPLFIILLVKMLLLPLGMWAVLELLSVKSSMIASIIFQMAAPPMITAAAILISARIAVPLVGSALGLGTILGFILWPLWALVLT